MVATVAKTGVLQTRIWTSAMIEHVHKNQRNLSILFNGDSSSLLSFKRTLKLFSL
jgi:hypothetical protein